MSTKTGTDRYKPPLWNCQTGWNKPALVWKLYSLIRQGLLAQAQCCIYVTIWLLDWSWLSSHQLRKWSEGAHIRHAKHMFKKKSGKILLGLVMLQNALLLVTFVLWLIVFFVCLLGFGFNFFFFFFGSALRELLVTKLSSLREDLPRKTSAKVSLLFSMFTCYWFISAVPGKPTADCLYFLFFKLLMKWNVLDQSHHMLTTEALSNKSHPGNLSSSHCTFLIFPLTAS